MTAECEFCGEPVTPVSRLAEYHVCGDCLKNRVQVGDRTTPNDSDGEEVR